VEVAEVVAEVGVAEAGGGGGGGGGGTGAGAGAGAGGTTKAGYKALIPPFPHFGHAGHSCFFLRINRYTTTPPITAPYINFLSCSINIF